MSKVIMDDIGMSKTLKRISHEIIEKNSSLQDLILVGIKRRGVPLSNRIHDNIKEFENVDIKTESLDITFYRDDLTKKSEQPVLNDIDLSISIDNKKVILVDDVIYTGRTVRAALDALLNHGRPSSIELAVLIDRGHREIPIKPDYVGKNIPTSRDEHINVCVKEIDNIDTVYLKKKGGE